MKAAAILALVIAIVAGLWGGIGLVVTANDRADAVRGLSTYSSSFYYDLGKIAALDAEEREDCFLILFAFTAMTASIALFAQAKHIAMSHPKEAKPVIEPQPINWSSSPL
jgi:hypothetical protein